MSVVVVIAVLTIALLVALVFLVACFVAWTRAEREVEQLQQRLDNLRVRRTGAA